MRIGALVIPGLGPVVAGGCGDRLRGGWGTAWQGRASAPPLGTPRRPRGLGMPESEARYFEPGSGLGSVVTVRGRRRVLEAMAILDRYARYGTGTGPGPSGLTPRWADGAQTHTRRSSALMQ